jgi:glycosyltransferase involved in cell wall biosynthesis
MISPSSSSARISDNAPVKILQLLEAAATGAGRHVVDLTEGLLARGHEVHLLYSPLRCDRVFVAGLDHLKTKRNFHSLPVSIQRYPSTSDLLVIAKLRRYLRTCGPFDLVHCHSTKAGLIGRAGLIGLSVKRLYTPHGFLSMDPATGPVTAGIASRLEKVLAKLAAGVAVVSREEYAHAVAIGIPHGRLCLIPNGVVPAPIDNLENQRFSSRRDWGLEEGEVCIGFVGRLTPVKAPEVMLNSFAAFRRRCRAPARLVMIGDGPLSAALRRQAANLNLEGNVLWLGARDARPLMPGFDIFALTSKSEGHPLVVLEAMTRGLPIVATRVGGIADTVRSGVNGFIGPVGDEDSIANALQKLADDSALRTRMGQASRSLSRHFSADRALEQTLAFYQEILADVFEGRTASLSNLAASS